MVAIENIYVYKRKVGSEWMSFAVISQEDASKISKAFKELRLDEGVIVMECHRVL